MNIEKVLKTIFTIELCAATKYYTSLAILMLL